MKIPTVITQSSAFSEVLAIIKILQHAKFRELISLIEETKAQMPEDFGGVVTTTHIHEYIVSNRHKTEGFKTLTEKSTRTHALVRKLRGCGILKEVSKPSKLNATDKSGILQENRSIYLDFDLEKIQKIEKIVDEWASTKS